MSGGDAHGMVRVDEQTAGPLRRAFTIERPPPATPASRRLRALIGLTALATVVVEVLNLGYAPEPGFALGVRTVWALLRALGFLFLMREVRYARLSARPFGLILAVTTVFSVARLVLPRVGTLLPRGPVLVGFLVLVTLCLLDVWLLYRSPAIERHLTRRPPRRPVPPWVLTTRIAALSYGALMLVPCLVAAGSLSGRPRLDLSYALPVVAAWFALSLVVGFTVPWLTIFLLFGRRWPRWLLGIVSVALLVVQPALCWLLLGVDGLVRDGGPMVVSIGLALCGLWRTRRLTPAAPRSASPAL